MRARWQRGYTLIEVMMALGILSAGAVGVLSLHRASMQGNLEARQLSMATESARVWLERLQRDGQLWTQRGQNGLLNTEYLDQAPVGGGMSEWFAPVPEAGSGESFAFDFQGQDTTANDAMEYCAHTRIGFVVPDEAVRAEVRVWWHRMGRSNGDGLSNRNLFAGCAANAPADVTAELAATPSRLHAVFASTVVRWRVAP